MKNESKIVMLQYDLKSFYISSLELDVLKSICSLDPKMIQTISIQNDDFEEVMELMDMSLKTSTMRDYISSIENELTPKGIMVISLKFEDDTYLHFQTGEFSLSASDAKMIQTIAIELLNLCGFNGKNIYKKLKSNKQFYIAISEDSEFEYLYPHPFPEDDDID
jgi:hypothetical protein